MRAEWEGVTIEWHGGRLADITMATKHDPAPHAVECLQVGEYDWQGSRLVKDPTRVELRMLLKAWMRDHYQHFWANA